MSADILPFRPRTEPLPVSIESDVAKEPISLEQERIRRRIGFVGIDNFDGDGA